MAINPDQRGEQRKHFPLTREQLKAAAVGTGILAGTIFQWVIFTKLLGANSGINMTTIIQGGAMIAGVDGGAAALYHTGKSLIARLRRS